MLDLVKHNLMVYMYSEDCRLENDMVQLLNNVSYRKADQLEVGFILLFFIKRNLLFCAVYRNI